MEIIRLKPACKSIIWGGDKLKRFYGKQSESDKIAESWELSFHPSGLTLDENGRALKDVLTDKELGSNCKKFKFFPMLIKLIDAGDNLSVQVHPSDDYALKNENSFGKTEMWYIVDADEGAGIYLGFKRGVKKKEFSESVDNGTIFELLNFYKVKKGEHYFIPSGTVHAIGKGCLICEIQQNSDLTYRVYDYKRTDAQGNFRQLHIDKALKVLNFNKFVNKPLNSKFGYKTLIGKCEYFEVYKADIDGNETENVLKDSFLAATVVEGSGTVGDKTAHTGDSFFVPSGFGELSLKGKMTVILSKVPSSD